jgi:hypothetical protein
MKTLKTMLTIFLTTATLSAATGELTIFCASNEMLRAWRPGYEEPIVEVPLDFDYDVPGLAYDGENFWIINEADGRIYRFDNNGDLITDFQSPGPDPVSLAFDSEYLWISCDLPGVDDYVMVYCVTLEGDPGPYPSFEGQGNAGLACHGGLIVTLNLAFFTVFYDKYGNQEHESSLLPDYGGSTWAYGLASDGEYLWANLYADSWLEARIYKFLAYSGYQVEGEGGWPGFHSNLSCGTWTYNPVIYESLGKIKAFFK